MRVAIIENGTVTNVIEADEAFAAQIGAIPCGSAGIGYTYVDGQFFPPDPPAPSAADIASRRYQAETAGFTWNGYYIATDRESQAKIDTEDRAIDRGLRADGKGWKCIDLTTNQIVFRATTNAEMHDLATASYAYVSACFDREAVLLDQLSAGTLTPDMLDQGWPQ
jgi:hypothetical protein